MKGEVIYPLRCFNMEYQSSSDVAIVVFVLFARVVAMLGVGLWGDRQTRAPDLTALYFLDLDLTWTWTNPMVARSRSDLMLIKLDLS